MDGVCGELMKYGSDELKSGITGVVKTIWKDERMSEDLDVAIYVLLRRKGVGRGTQFIEDFPNSIYAAKYLANDIFKLFRPYYPACVGNY